MRGLWNYARYAGAAQTVPEMWSAQPAQVTSTLALEYLNERDRKRTFRESRQRVQDAARAGRVGHGSRCTEVARR